jgi:hypothetical protein
VYDVLGKEVATLVNENLIAGSYEATFDASDLASGVSSKGRRLDSSSGYASGVYFYRLQSGNFIETKRMLLMK